MIQLRQIFNRLIRKDTGYTLHNIAGTGVNLQHIKSLDKPGDSNILEATAVNSVHVTKHEDADYYNKQEILIFIV